MGFGTMHDHKTHWMKEVIDTKNSKSVTSFGIMHDPKTHWMKDVINTKNSKSVMSFGIMHDHKTYWMKEVNSVFVHMVGWEENSEFSRVTEFSRLKRFLELSLE